MIATIAMMLLTGISAALTQLLDYFWKDDQSNRHKGARLSLLGLTILATVGGVVAAVVNEQSNERDRKAMHDELTGGDSYPRLSLQPVGPDGRIRLAAYGVGPNTLMGVKAMILDFTTMESLSDEKIVDVGIVSHEFPRPIDAFLSAPLTPGHRSYTVMLYAQNGVFEERVLIRSMATETGLCVYDYVTIRKEEWIKTDGGYEQPFPIKFLERPDGWRSHALPGKCPPQGMND